MTVPNFVGWFFEPYWMIRGRVPKKFARELCFCTLFANWGKNIFLICVFVKMHFFLYIYCVYIGDFFGIVCFKLKKKFAKRMYRLSCPLPTLILKKNECCLFVDLCPCCPWYVAQFLQPKLKFSFRYDCTKIIHNREAIFIRQTLLWSQWFYDFLHNFWN